MKSTLKTSIKRKEEKTKKEEEKTNKEEEIKEPEPKPQKTNEININEELNIKQKALTEAAEILKEKQNEAQETQINLEKFINELTNLEYAGRLLEEYKEKSIKLQEMLRNTTETYEKMINDVFNIIH